MINAYLLLFGAIIAEIIGSVALKYSDGLARLGPSLVVAVAYALSFWLFALALRVLPLGMTSAIWAGLGIVGSVLCGIFLFDERPGWVGVAGIAMIVSGTVLLTVFSNAGEHG